MREWLHLGGIALCLFALWAIARRDWLRLTRPVRRVLAEVCGHRKMVGGDGTDWAAIYRFQAEDGAHEVIDQVLSSKPSPPLGTMVELTYPAGGGVSLMRTALCWSSAPLPALQLRP